MVICTKGCLTTTVCILVAVLLKGDVEDKEVILVHLSYVYTPFWSSFGNRRRHFFAIDTVDASTDDNTFIFIDGRGISVIALHAIVKNS
jgi:hypothetical protein